MHLCEDILDTHEPRRDISTSDIKEIILAWIESVQEFVLLAAVETVVQKIPQNIGYWRPG